MFNGTKFPLIATNAYWLPALNSDQDIDNTLGNISQAGFNAIRLWGFNDVTSVPETGTWFQLINSDGTFTINNGTNGLPKLDTVVQLAEKHGLFIIMSLTNNWNPHPDDPSSDLMRRGMTSNTTVVRNLLSNQYGGMDTYVRQLAHTKQHDQFFVNQSIINAFKNYTTQVITRYVSSPAILSWEVANDARCNSSIPNADSCNTNVVTSWHSDVATHISQVDPNHLISSGVQGFFCADCPKLFQKPPAPPPPQPSSVHGVRRRTVPKPLTKKALLQERKEFLKKKRAAEIVKRTLTANGVRVRGRWFATPTKRQSEEVGVSSAFNGAQGVDSEDIVSIPQIGFGSFQLFPDQFTYGLQEADPPGLPSFEDSLAVGLDWIQRQAEASARTLKPIVMTGFGLVTQNNSQAFVPFNTTEAPFASPASNSHVSARQQQAVGVTDDQRDQAYLQWIQSSLTSGLSGVIQYQWGQSNLQPGPGTAITTTGTSTSVGPVSDQSGVSPNDGYSTQGTGSANFVSIIQQAEQSFGSAS